MITDFCLPSSIRSREDLVNSSCFHSFSRLQLPNGDGSMVYAGSLNITQLSNYCDNELVAWFAHAMLNLIHEQKGGIEEDMNHATNDTDIDFDRPIGPVIQTALTFVFMVVGCVGMLGNLLTVIVIHKTPILHSHTNYFLMSLAISDFCLIVVGVPFDLLHLWRRGQSPAISGYCEFMSTSISLFTFASILTIVSLTAERFVAICYPFSLRSLFDRNRVISLIYAIWVFAFFPSLYIGLQFKQVNQDFCGYNRELGLGYGSCDYVTSQAVPFRYPFELTLLLTFVIPMCFIFYMHVRILRTLNEMSHATQVHQPVVNTSSDSSQIRCSQLPAGLFVHMKNSTQPKSQQAQKMVIKMLVIITVVFFTCYLPYHIERLIVQYTKQRCDHSLPCLLLYPITGLLQYVSATLNPIFYNLMSLRFRSATKQLLRRMFTKEKEYSSIVRL